MPNLPCKTVQRRLQVVAVMVAAIIPLYRLALPLIWVVAPAMG